MLGKKFEIYIIICEVAAKTADSIETNNRSSMPVVTFYYTAGTETRLTSPKMFSHYV